LFHPFAVFQPQLLNWKTHIPPLCTPYTLKTIIHALFVEGGGQIAGGVAW
jgi:hypothetical protein